MLNVIKSTYFTVKVNETEIITQGKSMEAAVQERNDVDVGHVTRTAFQEQRWERE